MTAFASSPSAHPKRKRLSTKGMSAKPSANRLKRYIRDESTARMIPTRMSRTKPMRSVETKNSERRSGVTKMFKRFFSHTSSRNAMQTNFFDVDAQKPPYQELHHRPVNDVHDARKTSLIEIEVADEKGVDAMEFHGNENC